MTEVTIRIEDTQDGYRKLIQCKALPQYRVVGDTVITDELSYAAVFGGMVHSVEMVDAPHLLDFQESVTREALCRKRYAALLDCGLGKTAIELAWAYSVATIGKVLFLCPLSVFEQIIRESERWHGTKPVNLRRGEPWESGVAILNYEARREIDMTGVAGIIIDEASILKNDTGATRDWLCALSSSVEYRLTASATPAPNDQEEYASQAVFLGLAKTSKEFYARFFRKDGNKWVIKGWAREAFYKYLATWATYIKSPSSLGYSCMTEMMEEPDYLFLSVDGGGAPTPELGLFPTSEDGAFRAAVFGALRSDKDSPRTKAVVDFCTGHKTIVWCSRNSEEKMFSQLLERSVVINGQTPVEDRVVAMADWRAGKYDHLISKPTVLGFGVNLPEADRMAYSGYTYSFEQFYQAVRRAHRFGRTGRLKVLVPVMFPEVPVVNSLRRKMGTFDRDVMELQSRMARVNK